MSDHDLEIAQTLGKIDGRLEGLEASVPKIFEKLDALPCPEHAVSIATLRAELPIIVAEAVKASVPAPASGVTKKQLTLICGLVLAGVEAVKALI